MNNLIIILGGGIIKRNGIWRTTNFSEGDKFGVDGSNIRVIAAKYLYEHDSDAFIIASGGKGQYKNIADFPPVAKVIKKELIDLGIPKNKIICETKSGNTYQQLKALKKIISEYNFKEVIIISNEHQLPRIKAMLEFAPYIKNIYAQTKIIIESAEKILIKYAGEKYENMIKKAYQSEPIRNRIKIEKKGVNQIKDGTYKFI